MLIIQAGDESVNIGERGPVGKQVDSNKARPRPWGVYQTANTFQQVLRLIPQVGDCGPLVGHKHGVTDLDLRRAVENGISAQVAGRALHMLS